MVDGGIALVKYVLFITNFLIWLGGLALVVIGAVLQLKFSNIADILGDERLATPLILLAIGSTCALLGFLGCCGAIRENYCLTVSFAVVLALLLLLETAIAIAAYALHEPVQETMKDQLTKGLHRYNNSRGVAIAWDRAQQELQCCGVTNITDWKEAIGTVPDSCCVHYHKGCALMPQPILHLKGCMQTAENWIMVNAALIGGISVIIGTVQMIGICFACCLSKSILKDFHDYYY
uniref:Tetraspanin n=1 Tax=Parastrongyloides trichosuri TaxID=131310 RepID=A0A0N4ZSK6_PARTI